jgi:MFS family permease
MGMTVDRWFNRGRTDAHFRFYIIVCPIIAILVGTAFLADKSVMFLLWYSLAIGLLPMAGIASGALQIATPNSLRGQISAVYVFFINLIGLGLGPALPGFLTDFVFHDVAKLGLALFTTIVLAAPLAVLALGWACQPMRDAVSSSTPRQGHESAATR